MYLLKGEPAKEEKEIAGQAKYSRRKIVSNWTRYEEPSDGPRLFIHVPISSLNRLCGRRRRSCEGSVNNVKDEA
jgi:hypothetical protein